MGGFCESCQNNNNDDSDSQKSSKNNRPEMDLLPKQYVSEKNNKKIIPISELHEKETEKEDENNFKSKNKNYSKSKSVININKNGKRKSCKLIKGKIYNPYFQTEIKKSNSFNISEEKKIKIIDKEIESLEKKLALIQNKKIEIINNSYPKFTRPMRRQKKSTTLMQNNQVINRLKKIQMSIPLAQELLVPKQKGKPSDK